VAQLGRHAPDEPRAVLSALAAVEREAPVMGALLLALHALGDPSVVELAHGSPRTLAGGELWLVGDGSGRVEAATGSTVARGSMTDGVARLDTPRAGSATIRTRDGDAAPRLAFSRPAP
jgi:hypothetical protein